MCPVKSNKLSDDFVAESSADLYNEDKDINEPVKRSRAKRSAKYI